MLRSYYQIKEDDTVTRLRPYAHELARTFTYEKLPVKSTYNIPSDAVGKPVDWIDYPLPMVSDQLKALIGKYNPNLKFKQIQCINTNQNEDDQGQSLTYFAVSVPLLDALSPYSEYHPGGSLKRIVLNYNNIKKHHIFALRQETTHGNCIVISLELAESILRRKLSGFSLQNVALDAGGDLDEVLG